MSYTRADVSVCSARLQLLLRKYRIGRIWCVIVIRQIDHTELNGVNLHLHVALFCHIGMVFYV